MCGTDLGIDENKRIRLVSVDPSTTNMGIAVIDVNIVEEEKFKLVHVGTIFGDKVDYHDKPNYDERPAMKRSYGLAKAYKDILEIFEPNVAIVEDNFLGRSADTYKQLITAVCLLRQATKEYDPRMYLMNILPNIAKAVVDANFKGTQKEDVLHGLEKYPHLDFNGFDLSLLDDHSTDAIAIGLWLSELIAKDYRVFGSWKKIAKK